MICRRHRWYEYNQVVALCIMCILNYCDKNVHNNVKLSVIFSHLWNVTIPVVPVSTRILPGICKGTDQWCEGLTGVIEKSKWWPVRGIFLRLETVGSLLRSEVFFTYRSNHGASHGFVEAVCGRFPLRAMYLGHASTSTIYLEVNIHATMLDH